MSNKPPAGTIKGRGAAGNPRERFEAYTREILDVLAEFKHPVGIVTKSSLVERDIDILSDMAKQGLAHAFVSITTLDADLARAMEPRAVAPYRRICAAKANSLR